MPDPLFNIRHSFTLLDQRVRTALRTQLGDAPRLRAQIDDCARFLSSAEQHAALFSPAEFTHLRTNIATMTRALEEAMNQSADPLTVPMLSVTEEPPPGRRKVGRPAKNINKTFLEGALQLRGPTGIARSLNCHPRTVRRYALKHGLATPGPPVYQDTYIENGEPLRVWQSTRPTIAAISDMPDDLDAQVADILHLFPHFGRTMISGALLARGFRVPEDRIRASYQPLIRWKLVTHAFIDGKSRFVTGARVSNNNRGATVLALFECAIGLHGLPSRVRVSYSNTHFGPERLVRSVHNIRIERLWVDFTRGIASKWVDFFFELELYYGLS
ncbi:hypothetical protein FB45DRAFT_706677, partial [Roridomyces roridus]